MNEIWDQIGKHHKSLNELLQVPWQLPHHPSNEGEGHQKNGDI